jgi:hypothetical protein
MLLTKLYMGVAKNVRIRCLTCLDFRNTVRHLNHDKLYYLRLDHVIAKCSHANPIS